MCLCTTEPDATTLHGRCGEQKCVDPALQNGTNQLSVYCQRHFLLLTFQHLNMQINCTVKINPPAQSLIKTLYSKAVENSLLDCQLQEEIFLMRRNQIYGNFPLFPERQNNFSFLL